MHTEFLIVMGGFAPVRSDEKRVISEAECFNPSATVSGVWHQPAELSFHEPITDAASCTVRLRGRPRATPGRSTPLVSDSTEMSDSVLVLTAGFGRGGDTDYSADDRARYIDLSDSGGVVIAARIFDRLEPDRRMTGINGLLHPLHPPNHNTHPIQIRPLKPELFAKPTSSGQPIASEWRLLPAERAPSQMQTGAGGHAMMAVPEWSVAPLFSGERSVGFCDAIQTGFKIDSVNTHRVGFDGSECALAAYRIDDYRVGLRRTAMCSLGFELYRSQPALA